MIRAVPVLSSVALLAALACSHDDTEAQAPTTTSGTGGDTSAGGGSTGGNGHTGGQSAGGQGAGGGHGGTAGSAAGGAGGGATCTPFGAACVQGVDLCCDAVGQAGECFAFGQGDKCTILCPPNPADCPNNGAGCNNQNPARCKAP